MLVLPRSYISLGAKRTTEDKALKKQDAKKYGTSRKLRSKDFWPSGHTVSFGKGQAVPSTVMVAAAR